MGLMNTRLSTITYSHMYFFHQQFIIVRSSELNEFKTLTRLHACLTGMGNLLSLLSTRLLCSLHERESWKVCHPWGEGGTRYIPGWGGAARPLILWPCLRQISLIFLPCLRQNFDSTFLPAFLRVTGNPLFCKLLNNRLPGHCYNRLKVAVTSFVAFLLIYVPNQWKFNVPGINAKVNGSQY